MRSRCTTSYRSLSTLIALTGALACTAAPGVSPAQAADRTERLLVSFEPGTSAAASRAIVRDAGARRTRLIPRVGMRGVTVAAAAVDAVTRRLEASDAVRRVEPDAVLRPQDSVPDDPFFPQGTYAISGGAWGWYRSHTTTAWDITQGDPGVVVAVIDTGLKPTGLDFSDRLVPGYNVLSGTSDTASTAGNHGTYVAGVVGLTANTSTGSAGYCPGCKVMPVQVGTDSGAYTSDVATGVIWAADHGARVANMSIAGPTTTALTNAVAYARSKGVVVVAAAGNTNCNCATYPSALPGVLGVGGVSNSGAKAADSNYGTWVALAAPQGNMTAWPTLNGGPGYAQVGGTSLAAPAVAGIAGLLFSADPTLTATQVEQALTSSAKPASFSVGYGEVDALAALQALGYTAPAGSGIPVNTRSPRVLLQGSSTAINAPLTSAPQAGQILVRGQGAWTGAAPLNLAGVRWERCPVAGGACTLVGTGVRYTVQTADNGYALRLSITFSGPSGSATASSAPTAAVGGGSPPPPTAAPTVSAPPAISGSTVEGQILSASTGTWSGSPTSYAYQWQRCDSTGAACAAITGATTNKRTLASADVGSTLRVVVTASNAGGSASSTSAASGVVTAAPVVPAPTSTQTVQFSGSFNSKVKTRSFSLPVGAGPATSALSFDTARCGQLSLELRGAGSGLVTGPSVLRLDRSVVAGTATYVVSGSSRCSFSLTVTAPTA